MKQLKAVTEILASAKAEVEALLKGTEFNPIQLHVTSGLDRLSNHVAMIGGLNPSSPADVRNDFPPVKEVMGVSVARTPKVEPAELEPTKTEKELFVERVHELENNIVNIEDDKILEDYTSKTDQQVLRGVAKIAGVEDFKKAEINVDFLTKIREGLAAKKQLEEDTKAANENLNQ
jgi:hypothetical protein